MFTKKSYFTQFHNQWLLLGNYLYIIISSFFYISQFLNTYKKIYEKYAVGEGISFFSEMSIVNIILNRYGIIRWYIIYCEYTVLMICFNVGRDAAGETGWLCISEKWQFNNPLYDVGVRQCITVGLFVLD